MSELKIYFPFTEPTLSGIYFKNRVEKNFSETFLTAVGSFIIRVDLRLFKN